MLAWSNPATLRQFGRYLDTLGYTPARILTPELQELLNASDKCETVPADAIINVLEWCANVTGERHLGVAAANWIDVRGGYGPLSALWEYGPNLAAIARVNMNNIHLENGAIGFDIRESEGLTTIQHCVLISTRYGSRQFVEGSLMLSIRIARLVLGEDWSPEWVELAHPDTDRSNKLSLMMHSPVRYGADQNALVLRHADFVRRSRTANDRMFAFLEKSLFPHGGAADRDFVRSVEHVIATNLTYGRTSIDTVAGRLGMSTRTLQRRLAESGTVFATLLREVRSRMADEYFRFSATPDLTQLAFRLGYSDASAASRFLRQKVGTSAKELRKRAHPTPLSSDCVSGPS